MEESNIKTESAQDNRNFAPTSCLGIWLGGVALAPGLNLKL